ncbi:helicase C-terminal domain-containing protein [Giesbergeria anulus]|uniref:ATP-dependent DNA helicase DinG n=1 Tax=Giesbergeria anulus TaxID=180197 RepID=A0A1H9NUI4_9BURK|nr:helicase C-terminal domain-containing protein [Giesbergeria anulus]SER39325.1 ATP-dependent DNA helicase DinG [Giesbergeria anulus]
MENIQQNKLVASAYQALPIIMNGFLPRHQQKSMITRAFSLIKQSKVGVIEAGTGTGKSMGYLMPGITMAVTEDKVLVVSTATASLQDQLASKDIPIALRAYLMAGVEGIKVVVAKGRERYICPMKVDAIEQSTSSLFASEQEVENEKILHQAAQLWRDDFWDGSRDTLPFQMPPKQWMKIANTASGCTGSRCPLVGECPYYKMQAEMKNARVIITNHDYLLSNLSNVPNSIFARDCNIFIFDEAHHLSDKLLSAFARKLDLSGFWQEEIKGIMRLSPNAMKLEISAERVLGAWKLCEQAAAIMLGDARQHRFTLGEVPPQFKSYLLDLKGLLTGFHDLIREEKEEKGKGQKNNPLVMLVQGKMGELQGLVSDAILCIAEFTSDEKIARWIERNRTGVEIRCSPFDGASKARKHLWPVVKTAVLTSATFTSLGSFDAQCHALGLSSDTITLKLESPFDYSRAKLVVPKIAVEATDGRHTDTVISYVKNTVVKSKAKGILVHFTSRMLMEKCYEALSQRERESIIMQGQWPAWAMVEEHKRRIDAGQQSIMFGLDSLGEGVDLPGEYCTMVVMTRLPFPTPDDPVLATHAEHLEDAGKNPFQILTLPKMALKFAQIVGRLMRRETDYGLVIVLDRRLVTKRYGSQILKSSSFKQIARD